MLIQNKLCNIKFITCGHINIDMIDLFIKAANHMFINAYFEHEKETYYIYNSQIQCSKSESDCCSMVLSIAEIKNENLIQQLT